jgi:hypothetical protein
VVDASCESDLLYLLDFPEAQFYPAVVNDISTVSERRQDAIKLRGIDKFLTQQMLKLNVQWLKHGAVPVLGNCLIRMLTGGFATFGSRPRFRNGHSVATFQHN